MRLAVRSDIVFGAGARHVRSDDQGHRQPATLHQQLAGVAYRRFEGGLHPGPAVQGLQGRTEGRRLRIRSFVVVETLRKHLDEPHPACQLAGEAHRGLRDESGRTIVDDASHDLGLRGWPDGAGSR